MMDEAAQNLAWLAAVQRMSHPAQSACALPQHRLCYSCQLVAPSQQVVTDDGRALLVCADCALPLRLSMHAGHVPAAGERCLMQPHGSRARSGAAVPGAYAAHAAAQGSSEDDTADRPAAVHTAGPAAAAAAPSLPNRALAAIATATQAAGNFPSAAAAPSAPAFAMPRRLLDGTVPPGYKVCNLCAEMQLISAFPTSGERIKPYCHNCMPSVRRGMQMGMKMQTLREIYNDGGLPAVQAATGAHAGPSHVYGGGPHALSVTTRARSATEAQQHPYYEHTPSRSAADSQDAAPPVAAAASAPPAEITAAARASVDLLLAAAGGTLPLHDESLQAFQPSEAARSGSNALPGTRASPAKLSAAASAPPPGRDLCSPSAAHNLVHSTRMDRHAYFTHRSAPPDLAARPASGADAVPPGLQAIYQSSKQQPRGGA